MPKISIIIPVYNTAEYLPKCLDSIYAQSMDDFEVILINDGSPDDSQAIIDRYAAQYPDKTVALQQENAGQAAARNAGLRVAKGEFINFLDSDDYLHPDTLKISYTAACQNRADVVCYQAYWDKSGQLGIPQEQHFGCPDPLKEFVLTIATPCDKLIRRSLLTENELFFSEGRIYEDFELIPQLALHTDHIIFLEDRLYYYVIREGSTMQQTKYNPKFNSIFPVMETLRERFAGSKYLPELECLHIIHLLHDAGLRFLPFPEGKESLIRIADTMRAHFPHWYRNKYLKTKPVKFRIVCALLYYKQFRLLKLLLKG